MLPADEEDESEVSIVTVEPLDMYWVNLEKDTAPGRGWGRISREGRSANVSGLEGAGNAAGWLPVALPSACTTEDGRDRDNGASCEKGSGCPISGAIRPKECGTLQSKTSSSLATRDVLAPPRSICVVINVCMLTCAHSASTKDVELSTLLHDVDQRQKVSNLNQMHACFAVVFPNVPKIAIKVPDDVYVCDLCMSCTVSLSAPGPSLVYHPLKLLAAVPSEMSYVFTTTVS